MRTWRLVCVPIAFALALGACTLADPSASPLASAPASPRATPSPSAGAPPATAFAEWTRIDLPDPAPGVYGGGTPSSVVRFGDGYIAAGTVGTDCCDAGDPASRRGVLWTSVDGRIWALRDPVPEFAHATIGQLLTDGTRLIAVGSYALPVPNQPIPAVWTSEDGVTWQRTIGDAPSFVALTPRGLAGATLDTPVAGSTSFRFVSSSDGLAWTFTSSSLAAELRGSVATTDGSVMAVGTTDGTPRFGRPTLDTVMWRTRDGASWAGPDLLMLDAVPTLVTSVGMDVFVLADSSVQRSDGANDSVTRLWRLAADAEPDAIPMPFDTEGSLEALLAIRAELIAFGYANVGGTPTAMVWVSANGGDTWERVPDQPAWGGDGTQIAALVETPDGLIAVGRRWDSVTMHPLPEAWLAGP